MRIINICLFLLLFPVLSFAEKQVVNVYGWTGEMPIFAIRQFEKETGIKVNLSTYENNEILYTKLRANKNPGYDVIQPSSYFLDRMRRQEMLAELDKSQLSNWHYLNPAFLHPSYDPESQYSVPCLWGITGIFINNQSSPGRNIQKWSDLWDKKFNNQLLMLDDMREVFSIALISLGFSANDNNPEHIKAAFLKLKSLIKNVKVFTTDMVVSMITDEDARIGMAWNGDVFKAKQENASVQFIYPTEGFVVWVDNYAIPKNAPHKKAAHQFINFMLRPEIAMGISLVSRYPTANLAAQKLLPEEIRNNPLMYPPPSVLQRGQFQTDLTDEALALYEKYWEELKMGA